MKIVVTIDDEYYELLKHNVEVYHSDYVPVKLLAQGTPLPKGHGRLIDADKAIDEYGHYKKSHYYDATDLEDILNECETIIEAEE